MARKIKQVIEKNGLDRRESGYYSTPLEVSNYIYQRLTETKPNGGSVIDTCVGKEELSRPFLNKGFKVTGVDIVDHDVDYSCDFHNGDFIEMYEEFKSSDIFNDERNSFQDYDYWIANPPYNCHELDYIKSNKAHLKSIFSDVGVHNMYSMFFSAMIDMAKDGAVIGLITLDSFLTSKAHKELRSKILSECTVHDVILCPTNLFLDQGADVRTCIMILEKRKSDNSNTVRYLDRQPDKSEFFQSLSDREFKEDTLEDLILSNAVDNNEFLIGVPDQVKELFQLARIGQKFKCVTGISTGNDKKYISSIPKDGFSIPFYKNPGSRKFFCNPDGYIINHLLEENEKVKNFMVRNIPLLYKSGITCSSMGVEFSACYLPENSTYGVNPNIICEEDDIWWLLAYLNSDLIKYVVRGVLIRTNMVTSGYISRVPVFDFSSEQKIELSALAKEAYKKAQGEEKIPNDVMRKVNGLIYQFTQLNKNTQEFITGFCDDIVKRT